MNSKNKRLFALIGVILLLILFIATLFFLATGQNQLAIVSLSLNGFVAVIIYFMGRFNQSAKDANIDLINPDKEDSLPK